MTRYVLMATEISGLRDPIYDSGAASKHYVDNSAGSFDATQYITSSSSIDRFADSSNIQSKFIHSDGYNASGEFYPSSLGKSLYDFSSNVQAGTITYTAISSAKISGSWVTPLYPTIPTASEHPGELIRLSGATDVPTWVMISVKNASNSWVWMQLGVTA
jgi:hypothetical protein